jgi:hypothetical protein
MALITWKFVDQPITSPTVLFDMNNGTTTRLLDKDGPQMPAPPLRRSIATNAMTDGGVLTSAAYDLRELTFTVWLNGPTLTDKITQLDALKRELAKPSNLLMFTPPGGSNPVFFQTIRSDEYVPDYRGAARTDWRIKCTVLAQPFAIGVRRDLATVTVTNDPAAGANPTRWDIAGSSIAGDSPTPAFMRISNLGAGGTAIIAQRTANNPTALTVFGQAEAATLGTDTTTWSNAIMSGGSGTATSFATAGLVTRLTFTLPSASSSEALRGRYRVLLRVHTGGTSATYTIRYVQNSGGSFVFGPQVSYKANTIWQLLDLGIIEFPAYATPASVGYSGLTPGLGTGTLAIQAARTNTGLDNLDIDYVYLMPADERQCTVSQTASTGYVVLDGPQDVTYGMAAGSNPFAATIAGRVIDNGGGLVPRIGGLPMLVPGVTNRLYMLVDKANITATTTVDVSYWPRWREVATS